MISHTNFKPQATASNGNFAVMVTELAGALSLASYAPSSLGKPENNELFKQLFAEAAQKLGWKKDRRTKSGWRKI